MRLRVVVAKVTALSMEVEDQTSAERLPFHLISCHLQQDQQVKRCGFADLCWNLKLQRTMGIDRTFVVKVVEESYLIVPPYAVDVTVFTTMKM